ncbi:putative enzymatic polyprotein [Sesamum angolense]|uniref:Enzymatic polyprotein n=1 Tax=Sesamum angolense TaxID=2727404 RepID=A0AAE1WWA8_9LAMI|nr:putative enzymatic polyprotein [Sesamum angolense]
MTVSNKTMERIMRQDSNLSPYDGFRIGGIGKVLNQIGLNQRKHHIIYNVSSGEFAIPMEFTGNVMEMQLIPKEEILEELSRLREEIAVTMKWIHIGTIEVVIKATFKEGIDSEIHLSIMDRRINNLRDGCLGTMIGKSISKFPEFSRNSLRTEFSSRMSFSKDRIIGYKGKEKDLSKVLTPQEIRVDNVKLRCPEGWKEIQVIFDITKNENFFPCDDLYHLPRPVIGRYEGMLEIAGYEIIVTGVAGRENGSMILGISFLEDHKPWGKGNAYIDSGSRICTAKPGVFPKEARETLPVIAGRDFSQKILILNTGIREAKIMIEGAFGMPWFRDKRKFGKVLLSFRQQGLIDSDSFYKESEEEIENLKEALEELKTMDISEESKLSLENVKRFIQRNFSENPLAWWDRNKIEATLKIKEECKYEYVRYKPIQMNMEDKKDMQIIIKEHINLGLIEPGISTYSRLGFLIKMEKESKKFTAFSTPQGQYIWNVLPMGLANAPQIFQRKMDNLFKDYFEFMFVYIDDILIASKNMKEHIKHLEIFSYACYKEGLVLSEKKATIAVNKIEFLGILIDEAGIELQEHIVEKIRNFPDILKDKKHLQSFLGVVNFSGIFIKDLAKYRKDFRPLLKETESAKWKWEEIHTQRVRELKQVCNNLPKLAIPQDEDELVVYTDANDYRWAAVLMKKTTTGEEPCRYTGGLFTEQQARVWHINEKEFFAVWKAFKKWPLFLLAKEFTLKVDNTNVKAFLKNKLESKIEKAQMEASEANSIILRLGHLRENLEELNKKFGRLAVNAQVARQIQRADLDTVQIAIRTTMVASTSLWNDLQESIRKASSSEMTKELKKHYTKHARRVQDSRPVAADSSTACTRPSPDFGEKATNESQGVKISDDSGQPSTSGVKEGEISLRPMIGTSKTNTNELSSSSSAWQVYQRMVWMMEGSKPEEVQEWYEFGALASVHTMSPSFPEISKLPEWISGAVYDSWQNNPHLKRGDILQLKFISAAPEIAGKWSHPAFHFIKLQRPDMVAFNRIKATTEEAPLVSAISEDDISTRRAWGFWVCLTEIDKVKKHVRKKRMLIWENKLPATEVTRMKTCNMLHVGQWHNHVCPCCEKQEKPLFGTKIRVTRKKPEPKPDKGKRKNFYKEK